jgi:rfaE bifunctional protein nucleotidyltransferase chain/domain
VLTNGCFDLLHPGHLASLEAARDQGDILVVALNSDASVAALKGPGRPLFGAVDRARLLLGLTAVDHVVHFGDADASDVIAALRPDVWCKGGDYADRDPSTIPELAVIASYGGDVAFVPFVDGHSTTSYLERVRTSTPTT